MAVIVVSWNNREDTARCLSSVFSQDYQNFVVILVDNASSDDTVAYVGEEYPDVVVISNESNLGYGRAVNIGLYAAMKIGADFFLPLNNDLVLDKRCLSTAVDAFASEGGGIGAVAPKLLWLEDRRRVYSVGAQVDFLFFIQLKRQRSNVIDEGQFSERRLLDAAGIFMVSRAVVAQCGGYDETFFLYLEDFDYCLRIRAKGFSVMFNPEMVMWHKGSASLGGHMNPRSVYYNTRNRFILWRRYIPPWKRFATILCFLAVTVPIRLVLLTASSTRRSGAASFLKGVHDGIRCLS